jgi:hypothetical protein
MEYRAFGDEARTHRKLIAEVLSNKVHPVLGFSVRSFT